MDITTAPKPTRCLRCGRVLRVSRTYGPVCRARIRAAAIAEAVKGFAAAQVEKARELIADGGLVPTSRPGVFRAVSSKGDGSYLAHPATCSCPAGRRGKATPCYHSLGARILTATSRKAA
jgi:ribosomal protein S14